MNGEQYPDRLPRRGPLGPPLVQVSLEDQTASIHRDKQTGSLWLRSASLLGVGFSPVRAPASDDFLPGSDFCDTIRYGIGRFLGGRLPVIATRGEGHSRDGSPLALAVEGPFWCAVLSANQSGVLRLWGEDGHLVLERQIRRIKDPWRPSWPRRLWDLIRPLPKGMHTYSSKDTPSMRRPPAPIDLTDQ